jgi:hypothetical protein
MIPLALGIHPKRSSVGGESQAGLKFTTRQNHAMSSTPFCSHLFESRMTLHRGDSQRCYITRTPCLQPAELGLGRRSLHRRTTTAIERGIDPMRRSCCSRSLWRFHRWPSRQAMLRIGGQTRPQSRSAAQGGDCPAPVAGDHDAQSGKSLGPFGALAVNPLLADSGTGSGGRSFLVRGSKNVWNSRIQARRPGRLHPVSNDL